MSRIPSPADRPIPTSEPTVATQETSETESVQKTDIAGKAPIEAEQVAKEPASTPETKGAQYESRLGGLARQSEMQSQFPVPSSPTLKEFPELRPNLDPNVHLDEKIDLTKNLPDGMAINKGLDGLDWGPSKAKTGPGNFGVDATYGGMMKPPKDVLGEFRNGGTPSKPGSGAPTNLRDQKMGLVSNGLEGQSPLFGPNWSRVDKKPPVETRENAVKARVDADNAAKAAADAAKAAAAAEKAAADAAAQAAAEAAKKKAEGGKMTDPDAAGGGGGIPSAGDIERIVNVHLGAVVHGVNPDLGVGNGPTTGDFKKPIDPLRDPGEEESIQLLSPEQAKLKSDIHGPRTVNPNSDVGPGKKDIPVVPPSGGDTGNPAGWKPE